jgi:hypothetical protein
MANFISGFVKKATDGTLASDITNATSGGGSGVMDQINNSGAVGGGGDSSGGDTKNTTQGLHDARQAFSDANKARHANDADPADPASPGAKPDKKKKVGKFLKSAFGFGNAAHKAEEAGEELTGKKLQMPFTNQN